METSRLRRARAHLDAGDFHLRYDSPCIDTGTNLSQPDRYHTLSASTNLTQTGWADVPEQANLPGNGSLHGLTHTNAARSQFYRVRVTVP